MLQVKGWEEALVVVAGGGCATVAMIKAVDGLVFGKGGSVFNTSYFQVDILSGKR